MYHASTALRMIPDVDPLAPRADSIQPTSVLRCGHTLHEHCFQEMQQNNQTSCPVCMKSFANMQPVRHRSCLRKPWCRRVYSLAQFLLPLRVTAPHTGIERGLSSRITGNLGVETRPHACRCGRRSRQSVGRPQCRSST